MNPRRWLHEHSLKLLAIRDTPEAIAGGVAIGLFFGFTPLFGLRFLASMFFAWLTRSNLPAARPRHPLARRHLAAHAGDLSLEIRRRLLAPQPPPPLAPAAAQNPLGTASLAGLVQQIGRA